MFTYLDPTVRNRLTEQGKLVHVLENGKPAKPGELEGADRAISILGPIPLPVNLGTEDVLYDWYAFVRHTRLEQVEEMADSCRLENRPSAFAGLSASMAVNSVLVRGVPDRWENPLVRIHSCCLTGDVFGSRRCECGPQLELALDRIRSEDDGGMVIYMAGHEGRGIGLWAKAATYLLQDGGENTYQANQSLGLPDDCRDFRDAATAIRYFLGNRPFRLLTNNPKKISDLEASGLDQFTREKHLAGINPDNSRYLSAKKGWGHDIEDEDLD